MLFAGWLVLTLWIAGSPKDTQAPLENPSSDNQKPKILGISFDPSKVIAVGKTMTATANASDPEDDTLEFKWNVEGGGEHDYDIQGDENILTFQGKRPGRYKVELSVCDVPQQSKPLCTTKKFFIKVVGRAPKNAHKKIKHAMKKDLLPDRRTL